MDRCHTLVIGASCYGAGIALGGGDGVLVVDRGAVIGGEYFDTYRFCSGWKNELKNAQPRELYRTMGDRRAMNGDRSDTYALAPFLYKMLNPYHKNFRLWADFLGIRPEGDGYIATLFDADGKREVFCERVIDTTPECVSSPAFGKANLLSARLSAVANAPDAPALLKEWGPSEGALRLGRTEDELFFTVPIDYAAGFPEARRKLVLEWNRRKEIFFRNNKLAFIAKRFDLTLAEDDKTFAPNHSFFNPARFENPLRAFDAGITFGRESK